MADPKSVFAMKKKIYCLRSHSGRRLVMRDGVGKTAPVYAVEADHWTPFAHMPVGVRLENDPEVEVVVVSELPDDIVWQKTEAQLKLERIASGRLSGAELDAIKDLERMVMSPSTKPELKAKAAKELQARTGG